jgi:hypothetical protein
MEKEENDYSHSLQKQEAVLHPMAVVITIHVEAKPSQWWQQLRSSGHT